MSSSHTYRPRPGIVGNRPDRIELAEQERTGQCRRLPERARRAGTGS